MASAAEVQTLLRFLSQDARVPLSTALSKINPLHAAQLVTPEAISKSNATSDLTPIFSGDEKLAKQVLAAAKRVSNPRKSEKRSASGQDVGGNSSKRARGARNGAPERGGQPQSPRELEVSLALPLSTLSVDDLQSITLQTNRAPLLLAFAVTLLKYTMPEQPLSSRLSLAQAAVSANSRTKAQSIGLVSGKSAEDEGWGEGQPRVRVMGRMVPVMRRSGYDPLDGSDDCDDDGVKREEEEEEEKGEDASQNTVVQEDQPRQSTAKQELPLWGLDLEALRSSNTASAPPTPTHNKYKPNNRIPSSSSSSMIDPTLPIHTPQSARSYLLKSFTQIQDQEDQTNTKPTSPAAAKAKAKPASLARDKETALAHLLLALDLLIASWAQTKTQTKTESTAASEAPLVAVDTASRTDVAELDRRAWSWYVQVRPDVEGGERGWGQKGRVSLGRILRLRK